MTAFDLTIISAVIVATNGAGWLALRTEIRWLRRDVDEIRTSYFEHLRDLHGRH